MSASTNAQRKELRRRIIAADVPNARPAIIDAVLAAAQSVDLPTLIPLPADLYGQDLALLPNAKEKITEIGSELLGLVSQRAVLSTFLEHKIAHDVEFQLNLLLVMLHPCVSASLVPHSSEPMFTLAEVSRFDLRDNRMYYLILGQALRLRPSATDKALEMIYLRLARAAIALHEPSAEPMDSQRRAVAEEAARITLAMYVQQCEELGMTATSCADAPLESAFHDALEAKSNSKKTTTDNGARGPKSLPLH
ncbi:hypothetical protein EV122DRAFT_256314 [Schizophyllum commune]